jgi:metallo-beta-lactamase class B
MITTILAFLGGIGLAELTIALTISVLPGFFLSRYILRKTLQKGEAGINQTAAYGAVLIAPSLLVVIGAIVWTISFFIFQAESRDSGYGLTEGDSTSTAQGLFANPDVVEPSGPPEWTQPYEPFRIVGNVYYVGTYDLACYLITTEAGNILINTGLAGSTQTIRENVEKLRFSFDETRILLTTQAHYDHVGAMAEIQYLTGAELKAHENDAKVLMDGGKSDFAFGGETSSFEAVYTNALLSNGDTIQLGSTTITLLHHPGHTKGSSSYMLDVRDQDRTYRVLIVNMPSIVVPKKFAEVTAYPTIAGDYAYTFEALKKLDFDIWLSSHANQFNLHAKRKPGDKYNPEVFIDRPGYDEAVKALEAAYVKKMAE